MRAIIGCMFLACISTVEAKKKATALHILMKEEDALLKVKEEIDAGGDFGALAEKHSTCPSGKKGGSLGSFGPGQMVKEFDTVVFDDATELDQVYGPVKTQFGYHLIKVTERDGKKGAGGGEEKKKKKKKAKKAPAMIEITSQADFKEKVLSHEDVFAVEFFSSMCGSCKEFSPIWAKYAKSTPPVRTAKVNIDDKGGMALAQSLGVMEEGVCGLYSSFREGASLQAPVHKHIFFSLKLVLLCSFLRISTQ